ncbi:tRNA (N6-isopentenyl adenosine(37)-C2)-methylthiotransferase MiaB [bacterium]|nr:tRNA (N6-isopentenyl adenosine(37)-C2)-methylthiotransferase MiaB [bacterium]
MNKHDSEVVLGLLLSQGYKAIESREKADVILVNTCSVRKHAEDKVYSMLGELTKIKKDRPDLVVGVMGCMAQKDKNGIFKRSSNVDFVCGTHNFQRIPKMIKTVVEQKTKIDLTEMGKQVFVSPTLSSRESKTSAWVSIMKGCDNFCSYCIVPYVRGREVSRPSEDILQEVKELAHAGYKELTLLGQNVNSYGKGLNENVDFSDLLELIHRIEGIELIDFVTSHPKDIPLKLIDAVANLEKVSRYLHFPLQSGSDKILRLMNRGYTLSHYMEIVNKLRERIPDIRLGTDIIVGFPGEDEEDFNKTYQAMKEIEFAQAYMFKYSPRERTAAFKLADDVPQQVKKERLNKIIELQKSISQKKKK